MRKLKNFEIFIEREECAALLSNIAEALRLDSFRIDERDASTIVIHEHNRIVRRAKSFNRLWEINDLSEVIVVLAGCRSGTALLAGHYYPLVHRSKLMKAAVSRFESGLHAGGVWLNGSGKKTEYWPHTFVGRCALSQFRSGQITLGDPAGRHFCPVEQMESEGTLEAKEDKYGRLPSTLE